MLTLSELGLLLQLRDEDIEFCSLDPSSFSFS
jgi:hypothetical protein